MISGGPDRDDVKNFSGGPGITLKALANSSPGLPQPWDASSHMLLNSEGVPEACATLANAFSFTIR